MTDLNCPACGNEVPSRLTHAKLLVCPSCTTSLFLEDDVVKNAGERSALAEEPSIFALGKTFQYRNWTFQPYGRIRFDYGRGFWDEWWVMLDTGGGRWMSVDEGEIAVESDFESDETPPPFDALQVGQRIGFAKQTVTVTEKNSARCIGLEGELPEIIHVGETHDYAHLSGPRGLLLTVEYHEGNIDVYRGAWIDPFEVVEL